ncbi:MAG: P-type conjugative transfer protein TrbJ [Bradyrhizobiaceae bacterium]|nr:P-type conjugative transfer protein TrbJ [Bradyrhizobiaceae bacterium]
MTGRGVRRLAIATALLSAARPAPGQTVVYDPSNYAQNLLQAARALQQINNQVTGLQNQAQMLLNQTRNLASLPYSAVQTIDQSIARTQQLLGQAQRIAYSPAAVDQAFMRSYPQSYPVSTPPRQLMSDAQTRWQNAVAGYQDALRVQAGIVQGLDVARSQTSRLLASSQSATGLLQASQAGNQLIALQTRQIFDLTALLAAQSRAQSLDGARLAAGEVQGRTQINRFLKPGRGYQPQTVQMFHQ